MKKLLVIFCLVAIPLCAQRFVRSVNTLTELVQGNPYDKNTNVFVVYGFASNDNLGGIYSYSIASTAATNAYDVLAPTNGIGRYFKLLPSIQSNTVSTLSVTNLYSSNIYVTNLYATFTSNSVYRSKVLVETNDTDFLTFSFPANKQAASIVVDGIVVAQTASSIASKAFLYYITAGRLDTDGGCNANTAITLGEFYEPAGDIDLVDNFGTYTGLTSVTVKLMAIPAFAGTTNITAYYLARPSGPVVITYP